MTTPDKDFRVNEATGLPTDAEAPKKRRRREALAKRRKAAGWTQQDFSEAVDVDPNTVSRWERGLSRPSQKVREAVAKALQISVFDLDALIERRPLSLATDLGSLRTSRRRNSDRRLGRRRRPDTKRPS